MVSVVLPCTDDFGPLTTVISVLMTMAMFASMLLLPIYLQTIRGFTSLQSGLLVLPGAVLMGIMSPITGKIFDKIGARWLAISGSALASAAMIGFARVSVTTSFLAMAILYATVMLGMSMMMMPIVTAGLNQLPQRLSPHGSAMANTVQQVAGAIGTALLVTVMTTQTKAHLAALISAQGAQTPSPAHLALAAKQASVFGMNAAFWVAFVMCASALVLSFFIMRTRPAMEPTAGGAELVGES